MKAFWNGRYSQTEYVYGKQPNTFFKSCLENIKPGKILLLGEGEGRNAVYAAFKGWVVDAIDYSIEAQKKALSLAKEDGVLINYTVGDLTSFEPKTDYYDAVGLVFVHFDAENRIKLHNKAVFALKPGGHLILESFEKDQIKQNSGGPKNADLLYTLEDITTDFIDLDFLTLSKETINLQEGDLHKGNAETIRFLGKK